jgi:hypothetical protein
MRSDERAQTRALVVVGFHRTQLALAGASVERLVLRQKVVWQ